MNKINIPIQYFYNLVYCIYFLKMNDEIVYIGKTVNIFKRLSSHVQERKKIFNNIDILVCDKSEMDALEIELIKKHKPKYNIVNNSDNNAELTQRRIISSSITRERNRILEKEIQKEKNRLLKKEFTKNEREIRQSRNIEMAKMYLKEMNIKEI